MNIKMPIRLDIVVGQHFRKIQYILWSFEHQNVNVLLIMDLSAEFDTVDHNVLLDLLQKKFRLRETVLKWFIDYLSNRIFKLCVEGEYSDCVDLKFSVPQVVY